MRRRPSSLRKATTGAAKRAEGAGAPGTILDGALAVACAAGAVRLVELQRSGKGPMKAADFLRGLQKPHREKCQRNRGRNF